MAGSLYLRPLAAFPVLSLGSDDEIRGCLPLAGGWLNFAAVEIIERQSRSGVRRRILGISDLFDQELGRNVLAASSQLEALYASRPRLAGLPLTRPLIMGIVNVTPDSFSDGGRLRTAKAAVQHALALVAEGADLIDIGGESTRPGSEPTSLEEELKRVLPVIEGVAAATRTPVSVDTRKAEVMRRAKAAGAVIINDVSALSFDPQAAATVAALELPVVLMHALGDPRTMQEEPRYDDVLLDVYDYLEARIAAAVEVGIRRDRIIVDPGIGFGKTLAHNLAILAGLGLYHGLGCPLLVGASRKRFIGALTGEAVADRRVSGSVAAALASIGQGAQIIRVHDVKATREARDVWLAALTGEGRDNPLTAASGRG
jgi:dihydropteroate synthase